MPLDPMGPRSRLSLHAGRPGAQRAGTMAGDEDRWRKVLEQSSLPPFLRDALIAKGYLTASIFSHSFPDNETLEKFLENFLLSADAAPPWACPRRTGRTRLQRGSCGAFGMTPKPTPLHVRHERRQQLPPGSGSTSSRRSSSSTKLKS